MRTALLLILCLVHPFCGVLSGICDAVGSAMQQRNGRVSDTHNTMIPDPESERDALSGCLGSINALGDAFSLDVAGHDQIVVECAIRLRYSAAVTIRASAGNNPFKVYGTGGDYVVKLKEKLK